MNRSELVFLYDISYANPNGDPLDENKPRIDEDVELNIVTDVRLKRTIRDYLHDFKGQGIFVKEIEDENGNIQDAKLRAMDYLIDENGEKVDITDKNLSLSQIKRIMYDNILKECVDVRLFGGTIPLEIKKKGKSSITLTGPVQFRFGRSMHKVEMKHIKGTGAFASSAGKKQKTFREEYILPYSLISFYGAINENAAKKTLMAEEDESLLVEGIWNGTKNLITRSKFGQMPRLLLKVTYSDANYFIGDLDKKIKIEHDLEDDKKLRSVDELQIDVSQLIIALKSDLDKIDSISVKFDPAVKFRDSVPIEVDLVEYLVGKGLPASELTI
ncbi:MAG: type I-B CRISPR-associated protein Cas7/Csh2 [Methanobacterium sp.]|jgi:CRISPR-associated protein Csh2|uniref:type I-B CRISPR-associated protein Cas7/Csh2 n=1 Tax=Methanobacterium sp. TaxID=2164 RepID=UPI002582E774|nr:type I-B CRISPR-associated protein Cas7/Csh2 [Methanobacterium sp.]MCC7561060.1 type I-B CRISPR-associated protein Cas7/Csh2 [Methanobacterium sp.]